MFSGEVLGEPNAVPLVEVHGLENVHSSLCAFAGP
jgi:hypothetical protein